MLDESVDARSRLLQRTRDVGLPKHVRFFLGGVAGAQLTIDFARAIRGDHPILLQPGQAEMREHDAREKFTRRIGREHNPGGGIIQILDTAQRLFVRHQRIAALRFVNHQHDGCGKVARFRPGHDQGVNRECGQLHPPGPKRFESRGVVRLVIGHADLDSAVTQFLFERLRTENAIAGE